MRLLKCWLILIICSLFFKASAFNPRNPVIQLGTEQGLSNNFVTSVFQDHNGFMWFGTYDGLNRYDGYGFKIFRNHIGDTNSIRSNIVYKINSDSDKNIWVGGQDGISIYNPLSEKFSSLKIIPPTRQGSIRFEDNVHCIKWIKGAGMLVGCQQNGLVLFRNCAAAGTQIRLTHGGQLITNYNVSYIELNPVNNKIYVFIQQRGLYEYDPVKKTLQLICSVLQEAIYMNADKKGRLWVGTSKGLYQYLTTSNSFSSSYLPGEYKVAGLSTDNKGGLWIATDGGGVWYLPNDATQAYPFFTGDNKNLINSNAISAIYPDKEGRIWIAALRGGINIVEPEVSPFRQVIYKGKGTGDLAENFILSLCEDGDNLWIGTDGAGLRYWDRAANTYRAYSQESNGSGKLSSNFITCIIQDHRKDVWIATWLGGINRYDKVSNTFKHFTCINSKTGLAENNVWQIYEDAKNRLWASTTNEGTLYIFNRADNKFELFDEKITNVQCLQEDRRGVLWGGNYDLLYRIDPENKKHRRFKIGYPVRCIWEDRFNNFWIGTQGGGLLLFNRTTGNYKRFTTSEGLPSNAILRLLEDKAGNLWMSTYNGLSRFDVRKKTFSNFFQSDGLQSNQFSFNAGLITAAGEIFFGGIKGFTYFKPDSVYNVARNLQLFLSAIRVSNTPVQDQPSLVTERDPDRITGITVPFDKAVLSLDYLALQYTDADKIKYAYKLQGWDKDWNAAGSIRTANYSKLLEGTYLFKVKVSDRGQQWSKETVLIKIIVLPPWYRTWWAYLSYIILGAIVLYFVNFYKKRQERLKYEVQVEKINATNERERARKELLIAQQQTELAQNQRQIAENEKEMAESRRQLSENEKALAEKEREINEKRISFFTNIAHEFRSPLTLIINPAKELLQSDEAAGNKANLKIIERNAKRLLSLVNQLLLFQKAESIADNITKTRLSVTDLCREVFLSFSVEAKNKKIDYTFETRPEHIMIDADYEKTEIILYNLVSNAIKYTPEGGRVMLILRVVKGEAELQVNDTGYGFTNETGNRIFDKFYRAENVNITSKSGFGIGLYLVKHFISLQGGSLAWQSEPGKGSSFAVSFPISGKEQQAGNLPGVIAQEPGFAAAVSAEDKELYDNPYNPLLTDKKIMLIVDDDGELRKYIRDLFKDSFLTYEAQNGNQGLEAAIQYHPDVIISDVVMPGLSGIDFCKQVKEKPELAHIPFLLLTGTGSEAIQLRGLEGGADDYLTKPFSKEILLARIKTLLKNRQQVQQYFYDEITRKLNSKNITTEDKVFLESCIAAVEEHLEDSQFSIEVLARLVNTSSSNLYRRIKAISGYTTNGFIRFVRLRKAARLFIETDQNVNEVAFEVGISDVKYFRENFNKLFGMNPSDFIKKYRKTFSRNYKINKK